MKIPLYVSFVFLIQVLGPSLGFSQPVSVVDNNAITCSILGDARLVQDGKRIKLKLFEWLKPGQQVETASRSSVILAFVNGDRYEIREKSLANVQETTLKALSGTVQKLAPVPAMIKIAPIAKGEKAGIRSAAARFRGNLDRLKPIPNLYPSEGAAVLAEAATLRFDPVEGCEKYDVRIETETVINILSVTTTSTEVKVPAGILRSGGTYRWRVRTMDAVKEAMSASAAFMTLTEENARVRTSLKAQAERSNDDSLIALLAILDHSLGLRREACQEMLTVTQHAPPNEAVKLALESFKCAEHNAAPRP